MSDDNNDSGQPIKKAAEWMVENDTAVLVGYYAGVAATAVVLGPVAALGIGAAVAKVGFATLYHGTKK